MYILYQKDKWLLTMVGGCITARVHTIILEWVYIYMYNVHSEVAYTITTCQLGQNQSDAS